MLCVRRLGRVTSQINYKVKVNSHVGGEFKPTNGLSQGSPLSPILYLLVLQSFLSLLNTTDALTGAGTNLIPGCASHGRVTGRGGRGVDP